MGLLHPHIQSPDNALPHSAAPELMAARMGAPRGLPRSPSVEGRRWLWSDWPCQDPWASSATETLALKFDSPKACAQGLHLTSKTLIIALLVGRRGRASVILPPPLPL